jgi:hypothetical protein
LLAELGIYATGFLVNEKFGWIFREQPIEDWGIDAQIEVFDQLWNSLCNWLR